MDIFPTLYLLYPHFIYSSYTIINRNIAYPFNAQCPKIVKHTLKILQQMLQDFLSVFDHFGTLCIKGL